MYALFAHVIRHIFLLSVSFTLEQQGSAASVRNLCLHPAGRILIAADKILSGDMACHAYQIISLLYRKAI